MAKQEQFGGGKQPEEKQETSPISTEKKESSTIDSAYFSSVSRFFNDARRNVMRNGETATEEDSQADSYLKDLGDNLANLAYPKQLEKMQSKDISFATSYLLGVMASSNPETHPDDEGDGIIEKDYRNAKNIFMVACKKMFPDVKADSTLRDLNTEIMTLNKLGMWQDPEGKIEGSNPYIDSQKLLKEDPKKLSQEIDSTLHANGGGMAEFGKEEFYNYRNGDGDIDREDKAQSRLASGVKSMYKVQLMRDELTRRMYGKTDITLAEIRQMDEARESVK